MKFICYLMGAAWGLFNGMAYAIGQPDLNHNFTRYYSEDFPEYQLLVTEPYRLNADRVKQYSGYFDIGDRSRHHMFFWFFESRSNPKTDPVILWLNGGPGCSSMEGLLMENGPAQVDAAELGLKTNPNSWNKRANVIYLDQPVGAGFSYSTSGSVHNTPAASRDVIAFLTMFFTNFPQYAKLPFHLMGESYAGRYIPVFASDIVANPNLPFKLKSIAVGNGMIDPLTQYGDGYYAKMCEFAKLDPKMCNAMSNGVASCRAAIANCYNNPTSRSDCVSATMRCERSQLNPYTKKKLNPYDYSKMCEGTDGLCYSSIGILEQYLNQPYVKQQLGARADLQYTSCSNSVNSGFNSAGDWMQPFTPRYGQLLDAGIPVLIYAGDKDFICNWLGNQASVKKFAWKGQAQYNRQLPVPWVIPNGGHVGDVTNYKHLTFLRIFDAGHLVPMDQPVPSLEMVLDWIDGKYSMGTVGKAIPPPKVTTKTRPAASPTLTKLPPSSENTLHINVSSVEDYAMNL